MTIDTIFNIFGTSLLLLLQMQKPRHILMPTLCSSGGIRCLLRHPYLTLSFTMGGVLLLYTILVLEGAKPTAGTNDRMTTEDYQPQGTDF